MSRRRAPEGHPDPDLARLSRDGVGDDAGDAEHHQDHADAGERPEDGEAEPRLAVGVAADERRQGVGVHDRDAAVDRPERPLHALEDGEGRSARPQQERAIGGRARPERDDDLRHRRVLQALVQRVRGHAHDLEVADQGERGARRAVPGERDRASERARSAQVSPSERAVDHGHAPRPRDVVGAKVAALQDRHAERPEVRVVREMEEAAPDVGVRRARDVVVPTDAAEERRAAGGRGRDDTRHRADADERLAQELLLLRRGAVALAGQGHAHEEQALGIEAEVDRLQVHERPHQQPGRAQEDERECDLEDDEGAAQPAAAEAAARALAGVPQRVHQVARGPRTARERGRTPPLSRRRGRGRTPARGRPAG